MSTTVSATTDRISLVGLSARGHHGVLPFEREEGQLFTVDVILDLGQRGTAVAAVTDSVTDAVDYSRVANGIVSIIEGEPVNLIDVPGGPDRAERSCPSPASWPPRSPCTSPRRPSMSPSRTSR